MLKQETRQKGHDHSSKDAILHSLESLGERPLWPLESRQIALCRKGWVEKRLMAECMSITFF